MPKCYNIDKGLVAILRLIVLCREKFCCLWLFLDSKYEIRLCVFSNVDDRFDHFLAQHENLDALFVALNNEEFEIRELAVCTIGRLSNLNPAFITPLLRKLLIQVTG